MARVIKRAAPNKSFKAFIDFIDRQTEILVKEKLKPYGVGSREAAQLVGMSRMNLYRVMKESGTRLSAGRKIEVYLKLMDFVNEIDEDATEPLVRDIDGLKLKSQR